MHVDGLVGEERLHLLACALSFQTVRTAVAAGKHLHAKSAYVDKWLEPGEYGGADAGLDEEHTLPQLGGSGTVHVLEWGGPKGLRLIFR